MALMGITHVEGTVTGPTGKRATLQLLVDSGAAYSVLPFSVWNEIGLRPKRSLTLRLADGSAIERQVSECRIELAQGDAHTPVILGEGHDQPLLGMVTLENLGLVFHPLTRTLQPMHMLLV